jgi:hypothetical protein
VFLIRTIYDKNVSYTHDKFVDRLCQLGFQLRFFLEGLLPGKVVDVFKRNEVVDYGNAFVVT